MNKHVKSNNPVEHLPNYLLAYKAMGFPGGSDGKESAYNAGDLDSFPGSRRSLGEGNGFLLLYSCLENSMDRGTWWSAVLGVVESRT